MSSDVRTSRRFVAALAWAAAVSAAFVFTIGPSGAQERPSAAASKDPRVGLKAGFRDAGEAARNMELVSTLPKPEGFFDPKEPAGPVSPPERDPKEQAAEEEKQKQAAANPAPAATATPAGAPATPAAGTDPKAAASAQPAPGAAQTPTPGTPAPTATPGTPPTPPAGGGGGGLGFANSDLAFAGNQMFIGNYHGFNSYDIENTRRPRLIASVVCPGGQGDVSVHGNLLFMSVEQTRGRLDCGVGGVTETVSKERFRGIRIFDISDMSKPKQLAAVQTCRGSHTHTLVTDPKDRTAIYVYGSGTSTVRPGEELEGCSAKDAKEDPNTSLFSIDVIKVPLAEPQNAAIVNRPRIFADPASGNIAGLWQGGDHGPGTQSSRMTNQCHDITVFPEVGLAAGACSGNGILLDISDPQNPARLDHVVDKSFAYWHSATFNNDGTKVVFTDEWGGGTRPRCRATDQTSWGANAIFDIVDKKMKFASYYKLPAPQTETENCVAHNGSLIPVPGRDLMVQGWYQGGISVFDFTDSTKPIEIAFFDRGPLSAKQLITGGYWSAYWYNGNIYGAEIARGIDVFRLLPSEHISKNEIDAATLMRLTEFNAQQQPRVAHPPSSVVARAYVDQLTRSKSLPAPRATAITQALDRVDGLQTGREANASAVVGEIDSLASQLEKDAAAASGIDANRMRMLASTLKGRTERLRAAF